MALVLTRSIAFGPPIEKAPTAECLYQEFRERSILAAPIRPEIHDFDESSVKIAETTAQTVVYNPRGQAYPTGPATIAAPAIPDVGALLANLGSILPAVGQQLPQQPQPQYQYNYTAQHQPQQQHQHHHQPPPVAAGYNTHPQGYGYQAPAPAAPSNAWGQNAPYTAPIAAAPPGNRWGTGGNTSGVTNHYTQAPSTEYRGAVNRREWGQRGKR